MFSAIQTEYRKSSTDVKQTYIKQTDVEQTDVKNIVCGG